MHEASKRAAWAVRLQFLKVAAVVTVAAFVMSVAAKAQHCDQTSIDVVPLNDQRYHDYQGFEGGLYPGGANVCPADHYDAGIDLGNQIEPLAPDGTPASDGSVGVVAIGFSIASAVFGRLMIDAPADPDLDPSVRFANAGLAGRYANDLADPFDLYWMIHVPAVLSAASLTHEQVQVVWLLDGFQRQRESFPGHVQTLEDLFVAIAQNLHYWFPNAKQCYVSPIPYQGYSTSNQGHEPYYFEQGFAIKGLIERQISGDPELEFDADDGPVASPWLAWGPYFWCDGVRTRSDGLQWTCADVNPDGIHPSNVGRQKLSDLLLHFFGSEPACTSWYFASGGGRAGHPAFIDLIGDGTRGTQGVPRLSASTLPTVPSSGDFAFKVESCVPDGNAWIVLGMQLYVSGGLDLGGGNLYVVPCSLLTIGLDVDGAATYVVGSIPDDPAYDSLTFYAQLVAVDPAGLDGRFALSTALELQLGD